MFPKLFEDNFFYVFSDAPESCLEPMAGPSKVAAVTSYGKQIRIMQFLVCDI